MFSKDIHSFIHFVVLTDAKMSLSGFSKIQIPYSRLSRIEETNLDGLRSCDFFNLSDCHGSGFIKMCKHVRELILYSSWLDLANLAPPESRIMV